MTDIISTDMHIHKRTTNETCYIMPLTETVQLFCWLNWTQQQVTRKTISVNDKNIVVYKVSGNILYEGEKCVWWALKSMFVFVFLTIWHLGGGWLLTWRCLNPAKDFSERESDHVASLGLVMMLMKRARIIYIASPSLHMHLHSCLWRRLTHHP